MANIGKTFEVLMDNMIAEQFLVSCHQGVAIFLKERNLKTVGELSEHADRYLEAQGQKNMGKGRKIRKYQMRENRLGAQSNFLCVTG